jgi:hypothetical protein
MHLSTASGCCGQGAEFRVSEMVAARGGSGSRGGGSVEGAAGGDGGGDKKKTMGEDLEAESTVNASNSTC